MVAETGRVDEAIELLRPHLAQPALVAVLVEVTDGRERDQEVGALLRAQIESRRSAAPQASQVTSNVVIPAAMVLERHGRVDEAIGLLEDQIDSRLGRSRNDIDHLAWLLQRVGAEDRLRPRKRVRRRSSRRPGTQRVLRSWLSTRAKGLETRPLPKLLLGFAPWDEAPGSLDDEIGGAYVDRDYQSLTASERRVLWEALRSTNRFESAVDLMDRLEETPPVWVVCI